jgi:hypothetical protein
MARNVLRLAAVNLAGFAFSAYTEIVEDEVHRLRSVSRQVLRPRHRSIALSTTRSTHDCAAASAALVPNESRRSARPPRETGP